MSALLEIENLHVAYGKVEAVRGVSLAMQPGQIVTVIGPNGAGKTTLLAAAAGLLRSRGKVIYDGLDLSRLDVEETSRHVECLELLEEMPRRAIRLVLEPQRAQVPATFGSNP